MMGPAPSPNIVGKLDIFFCMIFVVYLGHGMFRPVERNYVFVHISFLGWVPLYHWKPVFGDEITGI